ncbi:NAD-dependent deacetylase sirtuin-6 [Fusarium mexicanum]|uniref:protein acetyllysine N-acetyltransferase n=1 Tax=Fusarium mexicanum TaxID=751941 RepID=A0A8H5JC07_9HYPO|nr:NAD-dependent deacetylase sirtuin-6 [Fusarium mexicanum]
MASSAPKVAPPERRDPLDVIDKQADEIVALIKKSKHFIVFTGIPDFRGPEGAWTLRAQGRTRTGKSTSTLQAIPTPTHMALVELQNQGDLKYLVSQNCDGLHRRSGILRDRISELHGNSNREFCKDCGKEYIRDFRAVASYEKSVHDHRTGRKCTACGGNLHDTIINFGEFLPEEPLKLARSHAKKADLCIALGSSLSVPPASGIPETCGKSKRSKLIICNLQETFMEGLADMHVWAESDVLMTRVMDRLGYTIPSFILKRRLVIKLERDAHDRHIIVLTGVDDDGTPVTYLQSVKLEDSRRIVRSEPFSFVFREGLGTGAEVKFALEFMGHYNEPNVVIDYSVSEEDGAERVYDLSYDPRVSLSVNAFSLYESGTDNDVTKACDKAMSADIDCDREVISFLNGGWYGSLDSEALTDAVCTKACSQSLQDWYTNVSKDCEEDKARGGLRIWTGWNATCLKDTKTGRYCNDIIADFTDVGEDEELPHDELCHPCYVKRLEMYKPSPYALNIKWHEEQLELVHKKCASSTSTETAATTSSKSEPSGATTTAEASKTSQTASSEDKSVSSTRTPVQTTSSEPTASSTPKSAANFEQGEWFGSRALMLLLLMNLFFM